MKSPLRRLCQIFASYGPGMASEKAALLERLERAALPRAKDVLALHEALCFLRAYPDDDEVLGLADRMLERFAERRDSRRHRRALADSGVAGTETSFRFFAPAARRLARRWPGQVRVDWRQFDGDARLLRLLPFLALESERAAFDEEGLTARAWLLKHKGERTDAAFLLERWDALGHDRAVLDALYDDLDPPLVLSPGPDTPCRTREKVPGLPVTFQTGPLSRARPDLSAELERGPLSIRDATATEAVALIEMARSAMVPRERDLEVFAYANPADVRLVDAGGGLVFACIGVLPERRSLLEAVVGFLMLKNGVVLGYALCSALFRSSEIAFNVFESFRGGEAAVTFGRLLSVVRALYGSDVFAIDPYQLGHGNKEGLKSGAFWFYAKLGFGPRDRDVRRVYEGELSRMRADRAHRSDLATLKQLVPGYVFFPAKGRADVLGELSPTRVAGALSRLIAERFAGDRARAKATCEAEAGERLELRQSELASWSPDERSAFERWAPLVVALEGLDAWSTDERRAALQVIRDKGGVREDTFVERFERHAKLREAVRRLASARR
jgi:hypothetical protein